MTKLLAKLNSREKLISSLAIFVLLVLGLDLLVFEPYQQNMGNLQQRIDQEKVDLVWMREEVIRLPAAAAKRSDALFNGSLANLINQEVKAQSLNPYLSQMTPKGDDEISIRYSNIEFNRLVTFIAKIRDKGLKIKDLRINPGDNPAEVDSSLIFVKS